MSSIKITHVVSFLLSSIQLFQTFRSIQSSDQVPSRLKCWLSGSPACGKCFSKVHPREKKTTSISHTLIFKLEIPSTCCFCAKFSRDVFKSTTINYQIREFHATWRLGNVFLQSRFKNVLQRSLCCSALSAETGFLFEKARPNTNRWMKFNDLSSRYHLFFHKCWPNLLLIGA